MNESFLPEGQVAVVAGMQDLVLDIARALVDDPEFVSVEAMADGDATVIRLRVSQKDVGKIIGKQGRTARSLRTILGAASMKLHHRFSLDILEHGQAPRPLGQGMPAFSEDL
jgi:predicted RNA-binding protein YlqC (UPF0109 family)